MIESRSHTVRLGAPKAIRLALATYVALALGAPRVEARSAPEDMLKGKVILSDKSIPTRWNNVGSYVAQLRAMHKDVFWYDKKTGKVTVQYAAFFAQPVNDVQVNLVIFDVTAGAHTQKISTENFMNRGDRVIFNSVTFDKEDLEGNKKYLFVIESKRRTIASSTFTLRQEGEHYSGKVSFTDEETKK